MGATTWLPSTGHVSTRPRGFGASAYDSGYSTQGPKVRLFWTIGHGPGSQYDLTRIDEGSAPGTQVGIVPGNNTSHTLPPGSGGTTRKFWVRHLAQPAMSMPSLPLTRPASAWTSATVYMPPVLHAAISGPDMITASSTYQWNAGPSGGGSTPNYHFKWFYQKRPLSGPGPTVHVGFDNQVYSRYVIQETEWYFFRLIATVYDMHSAQYKYWADSADMLLVIVDAEGGIFGLRADGAQEAVPHGGLERPRIRGFVKATGECVAIPTERAARQRLFRELWELPGRIEMCVPETPPPPPSG